MFIHPFIFFILLGFLAHSVNGAETVVTLGDASVYALRQNPALSAARLRIDEARGRWKQSGRLTNPELELELSRNVREPEGSVGIAFTQKFPLTGRLRLEKNVTKAELSAVEAEVKNAERLLVYQVQTLVIKLLAFQEIESLRQKQLANSRELSRFTNRRIETGEGSAVDASLVDLETQQLEAELLQLAVERSALMGELRPLLGISTEDKLVIGGKLPAVNFLPKTTGILTSRPDFQAAQSTVEAARQNAALAEAQKWEDISVGVNLMEERAEDAPEGYERDTFAGVKFTLPLPFWNNNSGRIEEAKATATRAEKETESLALTIRSEASEARESMTALAKLITALERDLLPKMSQIEAQLRTSHANGQIALTEVLRVRDRRLLIERQRLDALRDFHLARVRYLSATNTLF